MNYGKLASKPELKIRLSGHVSIFLTQQLTCRMDKYLDFHMQ